MLTRFLVEKIRNELHLLKQQTATIDEHNSKIRSNRFKYRDIFNRQLFRCDSTKLFDYVLEAEQNFQQLIKGGNHLAHLTALGEKLTDQITALSQAVRANEVAVKENSYQSNRNKTQYQKRYKKAAQQFMVNSHQLYEELAQNHEFERRLNEMIYERQAQMSSADEPTRQKLEKEMLALHQRLGRCRRAITAVEERIQLAESK